MADDVDIVIDEFENDVEASAQAQPAREDPDTFFAKNAFRIIYQTNNFFLPQLRDLIDRGEVLNLRPEYQRRLRWTAVQKSKLIESLLLNIPIPPVFLFEGEAARYEVMDGQQRLNAVREFIAGDFALSGLTVLEPLNRLRYSRCPPRIKRALDRASLSAIVLLLESEPEKVDGALTITDIRRFIFDRLNTGGTKLNPQEIRNALNPGNFNKLIVELTRDKLFTEVFGIPHYAEAEPNEYYENDARRNNKLYASMGDCQLVLRYFALKDSKNVRGSMKAMLDRAMDQQVKDAEAEQMKFDYRERFKFLYEIFDGKPFNLLPEEKGTVRISAAIYDASMVAANDLWQYKEAIAADAAGVRARMDETLADPDKLTVLTGSGNTANSVRDRIKLMKNILRPV
ncbi:DUF262 domain-containing protein [Paracoccus yeei]|uniref:DUF262 domain-containing protein n=1 Tax=Paracoccus yeei TaxID=147645 RepID=UPI001C8D012F|nr:DUF262 domain-containing protein [Paracoccus yeei]MBY0137272.1 DUF262 domain-containing protein [Paracoccus yeei]